MTLPTPESKFEARVKDLQRSWKSAEKAARAIGYVKPADKSWDEAAIDIARMEMAQHPSEEPGNEETIQVKVAPDPLPIVYDTSSRPMEEIIHTPTEPPEVTADPGKPKLATEWYEASGIPHCKKCGEIFLTGMDGKPICADRLPKEECPYLSEVSE